MISGRGWACGKSSRHKAEDGADFFHVFMGDGDNIGVTLSAYATSCGTEEGDRRLLP